MKRLVFVFVFVFVGTSVAEAQMPTRVLAPEDPDGSGHSPRTGGAGAGEPMQIDAQISARLFLGGGAELPAQRPSNAIFDFGARAEVLIGDASAQRFRIGPAIDLRTATFRTFEAAGGAAVLLPLGYDFALEAMLGAGFAARPGGHDGGIGVLTLRLAYQPYDHFDCYSHGVALYGTGRAGLDGQTWEVTGGLEIDFEFLVATPIVYVATALSGHDPEEESDAPPLASAP